MGSQERLRSSGTYDRRIYSIYHDVIAVHTSDADEQSDPEGFNPLFGLCLTLWASYRTLLHAYGSISR